MAPDPAAMDTGFGPDMGGALFPVRDPLAAKVRLAGPADPRHDARGLRPSGRRGTFQTGSGMTSPRIGEFPWHTTTTGSLPPAAPPDGRAPTTAPPG